MSTGQSWRAKAVSWFQKYEKGLVFGLSLVIVATLAFQAGIIVSRGHSGGALVIEKPAVSLAELKREVGAEEGRVAGVQSAPQRTTDSSRPTTTQSDAPKDTQECLFVGSKNSNKYHSPSCSYAKRIKPENQVCFTSKEDAEGKGYVAGCIQ